MASSSSTSSSGLYAGTSANQDVDMALALDASKDDDEALSLLGDAEHQPRHATELIASAAATISAIDAASTANSNSNNNNNTRPSTAANKAKATGSSNVSAVYRWYEVEEGFSAKKREESSIAKCKLCRQQGKLERKTCVRFSKSVTSNLWRHLKENHPDVYEKHAGEKKSVQMHRVMGVKKRGRKKKVVTPTTRSTAGAAMSADATNSKPPIQTESGQVATTCPPVKKAKRGEEHTNLFSEFSVGVVNGVLQRPHQVTTGNRQAGVNAAAAATVPTAGNFNPEKVREAMGYLCLYEMLPFELCSSHAFRSLMMECSGGIGGYVNDCNSFTLFATEIASGYGKKMAAEVKVRTVMQMKMTDFSHLMLSEWRSSSYRAVNEAVAVSVSTADYPSTSPRDGEMVFLALFAVGLDQEFNPFRRCLNVSSIGTFCVGQGNSIAAKLAEDKEVKKAMGRVVPCRYMPQILAVDSPCDEYQSFCVDHNLHCLESVPTMLQNIMIATINGVHITGNYCMGQTVLTDADAPGSVGFRNRRLDKSEYIENSSAEVAEGASGDAMCGLSPGETFSSILEELPRSLTGHTYRDLVNKAMHLLAHFKQSPKSRSVLRKLAVEQSSMGADLYERLFINRLRDMAISVGGIYSVLSLVVDMMTVLKKYFLLHKDSDSDFSKLVQLSALSQYEWSRVRYLTVILKPFAEATAKLDDEKYVVSSLIVPSVFTLIEKLREPHPANIGLSTEVSGNGPAKKSGAEAIEDLPEDIEALRDLAFANLSTCFGYLLLVPEISWSMEKRQTFNLLWSATILDPRTRSFIIKGSLPQQEFWEIVKAEAANIAGTKMKDKENGNDLEESGISLDEDSGHVDGNGAGKSSDLWDDLQANLASCAQEEMLLSSAKSSLEITKCSNLLEVEVSFFQEEGRIVLRANPLEWWQNMRMKYPFLARLARYVLSIPCNVKVEDNPVLCDGGLVKRGPSQMSMPDLCDLLAASMNLRTEKNSHFEAASKQMWSTV